MRNIYLLSALSLLLLAACRKKESGAIANAFSIGDRSHNAVETTWDPINRTVRTADVFGNSIFIDFSTYPVVTKKYRIAEGLSIPDSNSVTVSALRVSDTTSYVSKGLSNLEVTVLVNGNNIAVIVPYCDAYNPMNSSDVIKISTSVQAKNFSQD